MSAPRRGGERGSRGGDPLGAASPCSKASGLFPVSPRPNAPEARSMPAGPPERGRGGTTNCVSGACRTALSECPRATDRKGRPARPVPNQIERPEEDDTFELSACRTHARHRSNTRKCHAVVKCKTWDVVGGITETGFVKLMSYLKPTLLVDARCVDAYY